MRIAVLSDIHANLTALDAVIADLKKTAPDLVVHGGDLVIGCHRPAEAIDRVRERGWPGVFGNTDEVLWKPELFESFMEATPRLAPVWKIVFHEHVPAITAMIGSDRLAWLSALPMVWRGSISVLHAAPDSVWRSPMFNATDEELAGAYGPLNAPIVAYGHIHLPFVRPLASMIVANCGSVGMPFDGDPRASYLLIDKGMPSIRRVEYDVEREAQELLRSGYPDAARTAETLRTARYVLPPSEA